MHSHLLLQTVRHLRRHVHARQTHRRDSDGGRQGGGREEWRGDGQGQAGLLRPHLCAGQSQAGEII